MKKGVTLMYTLYCLGCHGLTNINDKKNQEVHKDILLDTIKPFSTSLNILLSDNRSFLDTADVKKAVIFSFLDIHDYQDDTLSKGRAMEVMPNWIEYAGGLILYHIKFLTKKKQHIY